MSVDAEEPQRVTSKVSRARGGPLRIGIVAGESSGDQLGAALIAAMRAKVPDVRFFGMAGPKMIAAGCEAWAASEEIAVMGLVEVLPHLPRLIRLRASLVKRFRAARPHVFVGIDSPAFNLGLAKQLRSAECKTVQYVAPQVWAWRQGRVKGIGRACDLVLCLLPFETQFFEEHGVPAVFVGHPLADQIPMELDRLAARRALGIAVPVAEPAASAATTAMSSAAPMSVGAPSRTFVASTSGGSTAPTSPSSESNVSAETSPESATHVSAETLRPSKSSSSATGISRPSTAAPALDPIAPKVLDADAMAALGSDIFVPPAKGPAVVPRTSALIALLPGSRLGEVERLGDDFVRAAAWVAGQRPNIQFVAPMASPRVRHVFEKKIAEVPKAPRINLIDGQAQQVLAAADAVLVASGTATLETLLSRRPMVVAYRFGAITAFLLRGLGLVKVANFSQPNLLIGRSLVPEFLQEQVSGPALGEALLRVLDDQNLLAEMEREFRVVHETLRRGGAERAASAILERVRGHA